LQKGYKILIDAHNKGFYPVAPSCKAEAIITLGGINASLLSSAKIILGMETLLFSLMLKVYHTHRK